MYRNYEYELADIVGLSQSKKFYGIHFQNFYNVRNHSSRSFFRLCGQGRSLEIAWKNLEKSVGNIHATIYNK